MKSIFIFVLAVFLSSSALAETIVPKSKASVYINESGMKVTVVPLKKPSSKNALIYIQGAGDNEMDDMVWMHIAKKEKKDMRYVTKVRGVDWITMRNTQVRGWWSSWKSIQIRLYGGELQDLYLDPKASAKVDIPAIISQYKKDKVATSKLAKFDKSREQKEIITALNEEQKETKNKCGKKIPIVLDWKTMNEKIIKEYSIPALCERPFKALSHLCENSAADKKIIASKIKAIKCSFSKQQSLKILKGIIVFNVDPNHSNQDEFVRDTIKNQLH